MLYRSPEVVRKSSSPVRGSPERMNVQQLREELKSRGMSPIGKRAVLVQRLQDAEVKANPFITESLSASSVAPRSASRSPLRRNQPAAGAATKTTLMGPEDIGLLTSPITTIVLAGRCALAVARDFGGDGAGQPLALLNVAALAMLVFAVAHLQGPLEPVWRLITWYGRWMLLGILSSIGLGTGAHTFLLFLGPLIARVATAAHVCKTVDFPLDGPHAMLCPSGVYEKVAPTFLMILSKIKWEAFAWGLGTALGELPPYVVARACKFPLPLPLSASPSHPIASHLAPHHV